MTNENDENATTMRVTRAKAAAAPIEAADVPKKPATKRVTSTTTAAQTKRGALGDISNVNKTGDAAPKNGKKTAAGKTTLKDAAQPTKVQKTQSKTRSNGTALNARDKNTDLKRGASTAPGSGIPTKRPRKTVKEEEPDVENVVPPTDVEVPSKENKAVGTKLELPKEEPVYVEPAAEEDVVKEQPDDLDLEDRDDPYMVSEYVVEIFEYLKQLEITTMANPKYMENQNELEWKMRGILVDWLLEVHTRFRLLPETLFLAVNIIDRFLSTKVVQLDRLQLVGVTAMFIASKYEEVLSPHVQNFIHVADDGFTEDEILSAERFVLTALNYDLSYPNPMNFLRRISKADNYDIQTRTLGKYLLEIGCLDHRFIEYPPSQVAAAAMYLARLVLERGPWVSHFSYCYFASIN